MEFDRGGNLVTEGWWPVNSRALYVVSIFILLAGTPLRVSGELSEQLQTYVLKL